MRSVDVRVMFVHREFSSIGLSEADHSDQQHVRSPQRQHAFPPSRHDKLVSQHIPTFITLTIAKWYAGRFWERRGVSTREPFVYDMTASLQADSYSLHHCVTTSPESCHRLWIDSPPHGLRSDRNDEVLYALQWRAHTCV